MKENECTCGKCRRACTIKPGWFMPGEAEEVAKHLNLSLKELFDTYLGVDWWESADNIFVLAPAIVGEQTGAEYPGDPNGKCVFFNDEERCNIHLVKPFECRELTCTGSSIKRHKNVANSWKNNQEQIEKLLGREPEAKEFYEDSVLFLPSGW